MDSTIPRAIAIRPFNDIVLPAPDVPIETRIQQGNHGWLDPVVERIFLLANVTAGPCHMLLASFRETVTADVEKWMQKMGCRLPYFEHFLAFGSDQRCLEFQAQGPIVLLRPSDFDPLRVACMGMEPSAVSNPRTLYFEGRDRGCHALRSYLFLTQAS